ncbi:11783_t:CDS:2, partial [Entrophospora sp. SA101]
THTVMARKNNNRNFKNNNRNFRNNNQNFRNNNNKVGFNNRAGFNNGAGFNNNNNEAGFNNGAGLRNDNNVVCFINSILQVLVHLPNAERHLESTGNHQCYCSPVCIFNELKRLRIKLMESRQPVYAGPFITYLTDIEPFAEVNEQNDAFLYLCGILQK